MKKLFTLTLLALGLTIGAQAQNTVRVGGGGGGLAYDKGTNILNVGLGLGRSVRSYNYGWFGYSGIGASLNASYEIGFHEYFSAGIYGGVGRYGIARGWNMTAFGGGVRGSFHYVALANEALDLGFNEDKLDLYVTVALGAEVITTNIDDEFICLSRIGPTLISEQLWEGVTCFLSDWESIQNWATEHCLSGR